MNIDDLYKKAEPFIDPTPADGRSHEEQDMMAAGPAYKELTAKLVSEWPAIRDRLAKADALAEAVKNSIDWLTPTAEQRAHKTISEAEVALELLESALTTYQNKEIIQGEVGKEIFWQGDIIAGGEG